MGIGRALGRAGHGAFGLISDFDDEDGEFAWMADLNRETGRPIWFLLTDRMRQPERWRRIMGKVGGLRDRGAGITAQVGGRPIGVLLSVAGSMSPFALREAYQRLVPESLPLADRFARLRDPEVRRAILADKPTAERIAALPPVWKSLERDWAGMFPMAGVPDYEPPADASIAAIAEREGLDPQAAAYDHLAAGEDRLLFFPVANYATGDHEPVRQMLLSPHTLLGLSDGGAHCGAISDASTPTYMLTHWARDRARGPQIGLEAVVRMQTRDTAEYFGVKDRGRLAPGMMADINLIDFDRLALHSPEIVYDLPGGGRRFVQRADGYEATLVSGTPVFEQGEATGALPGRLLRAGRC